MPDTYPYLKSGQMKGELRGVLGAIAGDELHRQPAENVVRQALGKRDLRVAGHARRLVAHMLELAHQRLHRHTILQRYADQRGNRVHQAADGRSFLRHRDEHFARRAVFVEPDRDVSLVRADLELVRDRLALRGEAPAARDECFAGRRFMRRVIRPAV